MFQVVKIFPAGVNRTSLFMISTNFNYKHTNILYFLYVFVIIPFNNNFLNIVDVYKYSIVVSKDFFMSMRMYIQEHY